MSDVEHSPMVGGWTERTPIILSALQNLIREANRSTDSVQVGGTLSAGLERAWEMVLEAAGA